MVDSIGQRFREARQARSLSLEEIAQATRIRVRYLAALENGDYETLPSAAQARGFLRAYASYLGLDPKPLLEDLNQEAPYFSVSPPTTPVRPVEPTVVDQAEAEKIFVELGENLRSQREVLGLSLQDIERHTHLRIHYLKALEAGDINSLPSPVQGRGMLSNYASFLGMDSEAMLLRFAGGLQAILAAKQVSAPRRRPLVQYRPISMVSPLRRLLSVDFLVGSFIVIFLVGFVLWGGSRIAGIRSEEAGMTATSTAPSIADVLVAGPTLAATLTPSAEPDELLGETLPATPEAVLAVLSEDGLNGESAPDTETEEPDQTDQPPPIEGSSALQVYIMVRQRAWMRVLVDGQVEFDGRVIPGSAYPFSGDESIEILTGNGAALEVFFNEDELGPLGALGEVVQRVFSVQGVQTPTPTLTITPLPPTPTSLTSTPTLNETELPLGSPTP
jgi:cytoskeleton protein RodZ